MKMGGETARAAGDDEENSVLLGCWPPGRDGAYERVEAVGVASAESGSSVGQEAAAASPAANTVLGAGGMRRLMGAADSSVP